ncbi:MAG: DMT family transporter [Emcibacteraceae bacterium]|nr:DMT family transporter [Emcibacteraceae bacterium]
MSEKAEKISDGDTNHINMTAFIMLILGGVAIGTAPIFMRYSVVTPTSAAFWRLLLSLPLLFLWQVYDIKKNGGVATPTLNWLEIKPFIIVGFFFALDLTMWHWSVELTSVANSTLLANMAAIFTALLGFLFFGERFSKTFIFGMMLALMGAMSLMGHSFELAPENLSGDVLGLITAVAYAGYMIFSARARKKYSTVSIVLGTALFGCIFLFPIAINETGNFMPTNLIGWWPLIALGWFTHVVGQSLIIYSLAHLPAAFGSVTLLVQPVVAAVLAWILFGEFLSIYHFVGAGLIITGILVCKKGVRTK